MSRTYSPADRLLLQVDHALRTVFGRPHVTERADPGADPPEGALTAAQRDHLARLMRINHTGEVCAQALYQGQALTARLPGVRESMARAAAEENDHLDWCERRVHELGGRLSLLNPLWYAGSFLIGAAAGVAGDRWSLGFVAETERQVARHLDEHLAEVPTSDAKTRAILETMRADEASHATRAAEAGGAALPGPIQQAMQLVARVMTSTVYYV